MSGLGELLALALVGTARGALPSPGPQALAQASARLTRSDPEGTLLARAALLTLAQTAGRTPDPASDPLPVPAPAETRPEAPLRAARHLPLVMHTPQLPEWLSLCAQAGWRVPAAHLPGLLDLARQDAALRERLRPVLGERGAWLAGFNAEWRFVPATLDEAWTDASEAGREAMFRSLRERDPQASRDLLAARLPGERASSRKRLLGALLGTLSPADAALEPLLDGLLDDRSEDVRALARSALQRLPSSAYNARMAARLSALVQLGRPGVPGRLTGQLFSTPRPPVQPDPDGGRDGLDPALTASELLGHLLAALHPDTLLAALHLNPAQAVALARQHGALEALCGGAVASGHQGLAAALLPAFPDDPRLLLLGPPEALHGAVRQALLAADAERLRPLLEALPAPWPADLTPPLWEALRRSLRGVPYLSAWPHRWRELHTLTMVRAHPATLTDPPSPEDLTPVVQHVLSELRGTFDLRAAMQRAFKESHP